MPMNNMKFHVEIIEARQFATGATMNAKIATVLLSGLLFGCVQAQPPQASAPPPPPPAPAPAPAPPPAPVDRVVSIQGATCSDLLRLSGDDREAATMFYIGYQASRFRARIINVGGIPVITGLAVRYCEAYPERTVAGAFANAYASYLHSRRG
jgi:hypothetical protein